MNNNILTNFYTWAISQSPAIPVAEVRKSFDEFVKEFESDILPYYQHHEETFDEWGIHGRRHSTRSVIFCEVMSRYLLEKGEKIDFPFVRRLTGMHDAGRKGNGIDRWERDSAALLSDYLQKKGMPKEEAEKRSKLLIKSAPHDAIEYQLFQSADCLDIMRPITGNGGYEGFRREFLTFLRDSKIPAENQFREDLINEAWKFIQQTENMDFPKENKGFMTKFLSVIDHQYPILYKYMHS